MHTGISCLVCVGLYLFYHKRLWLSKATGMLIINMCRPIAKSSNYVIHPWIVYCQLCSNVFFLAFLLHFIACIHAKFLCFIEMYWIDVKACLHKCFVDSDELNGKKNPTFLLSTLLFRNIVMQFHCIGLEVSVLLRVEIKSELY